MSINVTVTGNPISIKRGKMVTSDSYQAKKDYEKRRLMRLEQVRQQSKNIAEDVRNKVRKEKEKQLRKIKDEGKEKLKSWQNKKLKELKTQYEGALHELGTAHKQATELEDENEIFAEQKKVNDQVASHRGQVAATKLQIQKNKESLKKAIPIQQKKLVRDIENTRAILVSNIKDNKSSKKKCSDRKKDNPVADINITVVSSDGENSEIGILDLGDSSEQDGSSNMDEEEGPSTSSCDCVDVSQSPRQSLDRRAESEESKGLTAHDREPPTYPEPSSPKRSTSLAQKIQERRNLIAEQQQKSSSMGPPLDTRISDRIKRRELMASKLDYCDTVAKTHPMPFIESNTQVRDAVDARKLNKSPIEINCVCGHKCPSLCGRIIRNREMEDQNEIISVDNHPKAKQTKPSLLPHDNEKSKPTRPTSLVADDNEIPEKPPVKLKNIRNHGKRMTAPSKDTLETYDSHKVKFYDHPNRHLYEKEVPLNAHVEKISQDSLEVIPNEVSEIEFYQKMKQRDREAILRGQKAFEKEKIQKDYEDMLKKLPLLQKKERIIEINKDKQEFHMSEERRKEMDRRKQNALDNAYSKLFPNLKPAIVTLPSKNRENELGQTLPEEPIQSLNVGEWDVDHEEQKMFTAEEVQNIVKAFTEQNPKDRREKLKQLLKSLKLQKEQLINEIKSLPSNDSINELINDLKSFSDSDDRASSRKKDKRSERKRRREEQDKETSTDSTTESTSSTSGKGEKNKNLEDKDKVSKHFDGKTPSPRKKHKKSRRKVLVLQNMSTQTTPKSSVTSDQEKISKGSDENVKSQDTVDKQKLSCPKLHIPCDCNKENESTDEVCQILIKLNNDDDPEVVVKAKEKHVTVPEQIIKEKESVQHKKTTFKSVGVGTEEVKDVSKPKKSPESKDPKEPQKSVEDKSKRIHSKKPRSEQKVTEKKASTPSEVHSVESKAKSWREHLSKNSISTSSTSYFSPPDFQKTSSEQSKQSLYNLRKKPQQGNLQDISPALSLSQSSSAEQRARELLLCIEKLLSRSRGSIENLTVSTSSVETPTQSVVEMESNNPLSQLHNLINFTHLKNICLDLSYSPDPSSVHYSVDGSTPDVSQPKTGAEKVVVGNGVSKSQGSKGVTDKESSSCSAKSKDSILAQYADITDSCSKRIAQLAAMIDQIREEKIQMLQNPLSAEVGDKTMSVDKDNSTAYLELPPSKDNSSKHSSENSESLDDEELQRRLLEIDFRLAEKLKKFSKGKISDDEKENSGSSKDSTEGANVTNKELWSRLHQLKQNERLCHGECRKSPTVEPPQEKLIFIPFLSDIPKLPKLAVPPERPPVVVEPIPAPRHPPPSKGLTAARKFNGNISLVPHELSTIAEAESQISTKVSSTNNSRTSQDISAQKEFEMPEISVIDKSTSTSLASTPPDSQSPSHVTKVALLSNAKCHEKCVGECSKTNSPEIIGTEVQKKNGTPPSIDSSEGSSSSLLILSASKKSVHVSTSSDEVDAVESMLKSIGMEWAIPTLHKTKEALALTSSSSSLELSSRQQMPSSDKTSTSEISLKGFMKQQLKITSSTMRPDASPVSFSGELSELSAIQANLSNAGGSARRTSTPVVSTEKSEKRVAFSEGSNISSVREGNSDKSSPISYRSVSDNSDSKR